MLDELDEEDSKKIKYVLLAGIAMVIFLLVLLWVMDNVMPTKKKRTKGTYSTGVTLHRDFRF